MSVLKAEDSSVTIALLSFSTVFVSGSSVIGCLPTSSSPIRIIGIVRLAVISFRLLRTHSESAFVNITHHYLLRCALSGLSITNVKYAVHCGCGSYINSSSGLYTPLPHPY